jgi:hypothetical protein
MIGLTRPAIPQVLASEGAAKTAEHCAAHESGSREFDFDSDIFGDRTVKDALVTMNSGKCSYCESFFRHVDPGTIDHFRPKTAVQQERGEPLERPGYYWLAYEWENLLLSCPICNQSFKRNLFPLVNPLQRAKNHSHDVSTEQPLLINPATEEPADFIGFHSEILFPMDENIRGRTTIDIFQLNDREYLVERRRVHLILVRLLINEVKNAPESEDGQKARALLRRMRESGEFLAMLRAAFPDQFI